MSLYTKIIDLQKLNAAWDHVRKNKPAQGADNITCEQFQENRQEELKQLQIELREHKYEVVLDISVYLSGIWKEHGETEMELWEYEQFYQIWKPEECASVKDPEQLLCHYRKLFADEDADVMVELMQEYTDRIEYQKASYWMQKKEQMEHSKNGKEKGKFQFA